MIGCTWPGCQTTSGCRGSCHDLTEEAERAVNLVDFNWPQRVERLECIVSVLAKALKLRGDLELEEVRRQLDALSSTKE